MADLPGDNDVPIELDGKELVLSPSLGACLAISKIAELNIAGYDISFTTSALWMLIVLGALWLVERVFEVRILGL